MMNLSPVDQTIHPDILLKNLLFRHHQPQFEAKSLHPLLLMHLDLQRMFSFNIHEAILGAMSLRIHCLKYLSTMSLETSFSQYQKIAAKLAFITNWVFEEMNEQSTQYAKVFYEIRIRNIDEFQKMLPLGLQNLSLQTKIQGSDFWM